MKTELKPRARVRVTVYRKGYLSHYVIATVVGWSKNGQVKVVPDRHKKPKRFSCQHIKLLHSN